MELPLCNIVWLKRDLRLRDHAPLAAASRDGLPLLLLYLFEPSLLAAPDSDARHLRFVWQSLGDLQAQLMPQGLKIAVLRAEMRDVLGYLAEHCRVAHIYSHQETGNGLSFARDRYVKAWCRRRGVAWEEFRQDGVRRGASHREGWLAAWEADMQAPLAAWGAGSLRPLTLDFPSAWQAAPPADALPAMQPGGETAGGKYLRSFLESRAEHYIRHLSKPQASRLHCSRLSPFLAWGNLSARQVYQAAEYFRQQGPFVRQLTHFRERLFWRSHYMQKLESGPWIEQENMNRGFDALDRQPDEGLFRAWAEGQTGFPMVDASMRCLAATGYLNFRMRAMLATFLTYQLWQPWQAGALHLARLFLDYEPGIHYAQFQMQAGTTGYHSLRVYNPATQSERHDPEGSFVKAWVPELAALPPALLAEPWKMTPLEQSLYGCVLGRDYPLPVVEFESASRRAKDRYQAVRLSPGVQEALPAIWERFCLPVNRQRYLQALGASDA